jgi:hypothetical protein
MSNAASNPTEPRATTDDIESLRVWVAQFSQHVAALEYDRAAEMMASEVTSFSTWHDVVVGVDHFVNDQWRRVWPTIDQFRFETEKMRAAVSDDRLMASVAVTWTSVGFDEAQVPFDRPGRGTFVLVRGSTNAPWRAIHGHFSLDRGVPQQSHGVRSPAT